MLMHAITHGGCTDTERESALLQTQMYVWLFVNCECQLVCLIYYFKKKLEKIATGAISVLIHVVSTVTVKSV